MIYLDYAATTPCEPAVVDAMMPFLTARFGNASSVDHAMGSEARRAVEEARAQVALLIGAKEEDVIFTSGSTEANNLVLTIPRFLITSAVEHPSVLEPVLHSLGSSNFLVLPVSDRGTVEPEVLQNALENHRGAMVSIMHTNNEIGTKNDIVALSSIAKTFDALFHSDVTQGVVTSEIGFRKNNVDAISLSAHKIYGPKGVGAIACRSSARKELKPLMLGGGHERGARSGTLNVPAIVGFGVAADLARRRRFDTRKQFVRLREVFVERLKRRFAQDVTLNGESNEDACSHIVSVRLRGVNNRALLRLASGKICFALGSACATNRNEPSHVLKAIGLDESACNETIRVSFGLPTSIDEAERAASILADDGNRLLQMVA